MPLTADKKAGAGYFDLPVTASSQAIPFEITASPVSVTTPVMITVTGQNKIATSANLTVNPPSLSEHHHLYAGHW